jgi:hypothetical protein
MRKADNTRQCDIVITQPYRLSRPFTGIALEFNYSRGTTPEMQERRGTLSRKYETEFHV